MRIGRTSENDVVLSDASVSRRHLRILSRSGRYFAEDLGSAQGTLLNGQSLTGEQALKNGDRLSLGSVELVFKARLFMGMDGPDDDATVLRKPGEMSADSSRAETEVEMPALQLPSSSGSPARTVVEMPAFVAESPPVRAAAPAPAPVRAAAPAPAPVRAAVASASSGPTAADRARQRRRARAETLGGQLASWWSELPIGGKGALLTLASCFLLGMGVTFVVVFHPQEGEVGPTGPEPRTLGPQPLPDSFGLGEGVTWTRPDMKSFDFDFVSPTRAVAVLHYQASGISLEEVHLSLNTVSVGWVPADLATSSERELQQILPPSLLERDKPNQLVFDNVRNPPGQDGWRVWNPWLEIIPVPELPPEKLLESARTYVARGRDFHERRDVSAENLFMSWRDYRSAWITLEALDDKPDLYHDVRYMLGQVEAELEQQCGKLMLDFQRSIQLKNRRRAAATLEEVKRRFPTPAHRCHNLALDKASQYEL